MKKIMLVFALALVMALAYAQENGRPGRPSRVPAVPYPVEWVQPSGDTIMIRIIGDENWSCRTTEDGFVLVENKKGALCYAKVDKEGGYRATCIVARRPERRRRCELRYIEKMKKNEKLWRRRNG
ncbi:MAG: hypothetical protein MJ002_03900 [Paludibacteraceae bacterium]|nr:hypothetical protein [Paludibacteraceae bacterium]